MEGEAPATYSYDFSFDQKKTLGPQEQSQLIRAFRTYDLNKDGKMDEKEFRNILVDMGYRKITDEEVSKIYGEFDLNKDGWISWSEFVNFMVKFKGGDDASKFGIVSGSKASVENAQGGKHTYSLEERSTFAKLINTYFANDPDLADRLPMNTNDETLFHACDNGVLLCKMLQKIDPNSIDSRAINKSNNMNVYQCTENIKMALSAAKSLGFKIIGVDQNDFIKKVPHQILSFLWPVLKEISAQQINLKDTPEMIKLCNEGEDMKDLLKLPVDQILIRWINYHLKKATQTPITNLGKDLSDSRALFHVLNQLDSAKCPLNGVTDEDLEQRAAKMITNAIALGVPDIASAHDIVQANVKINTLFVAEIFNCKHGLEELTKEEYEAAALLDE